MKNGLTRRDFLAASGSAAFAAMLAGCSFGVGSNKSASGGNKATVWDISTGQQQELMKDVVKRFNSDHKNMSMSVQFFQNDPYKNKLRTSMGAGNPPDLFYGWGGGILKSYVDAGKVEDIGSSVDTSKYFESVMGGVTFGGKVYGIPKAGMQPVIFYYNKSIFKKYNLSPPKIWSELLDIIESLKKNDVTPITLAGQNKWPYLMYEEYLVNRIGGPKPFNRVQNEEPDAWSDPAFIKANTMIQDLISMNAFPSNFSSLNYDTGQSTQLLTSGDAAMQLMGSWDYENVLSTAPDFIKNDDLGWFNFPEVDDGSGDPSNVAGNLTNFYSLTTASNSKKTAIAFLNDGVASDFMIDGLIDLGLVPPVQGIQSKLQKTDRADWLIYIYNLARDAAYYDLSWDQALPAESAQALLTNLDQLFLKQITPKQFSQNMNEAMGLNKG